MPKTEWSATAQCAYRDERGKPCGRLRSEHDLNFPSFGDHDFVEHKEVEVARHGTRIVWNQSLAGGAPQNTT